MAVDDYPEIAALEKALTDHGLRLSVEADRHLQSRSYRRIRLTLPHDRPDLSMPVDDEYGDARNDNPMLLLHLVLSECEGYEEADDFLVWAAESGLDASETWVQALFAELGEVVPEIREIVGSDVKPLSSYDFTLNAGAAQALRGL